MIEHVYAFRYLDAAWQHRERTGSTCIFREYGLDPGNWLCTPSLFYEVF